MSAKFTPGPWAVGEPNDFATSEIGVHSDKWCLLDMCMDIRDKSVDQEANARLIAAAPELLEACRQMMRWFEVEDDHSQMPEFIDRFSLCKQVEFIAASAIAKATGGAQ